MAAAQPQLIAVKPEGNNMYKTISRIALALIAALAAPLALSDEVAPDVLIKTVTLEVIAIVKADKDIQAGNPVKVADLVESKILPLFDFTRMTQLAVARNWRGATPEQQKLLTAEFRTLLVRTYSVALSSYRDQPIEFKRMRAGAGDTEVTVKSVIKQSGTESLAMDYDMEKTAAGWKVYDIKVDGVSLITTYRETFANKVHEGGVDGLIKSLADKNRQGESRSRPHQSGTDYFPRIVQSILQGGA
jgi:phospholipid transport system substrate-binding protein